MTSFQILFLFINQGFRRETSVQLKVKQTIAGRSSAHIALLWFTETVTANIIAQRCVESEQFEIVLLVV